MYIVIWQTPTKLYYKIVRGTYKKYYVGYYNQYDHKVIFVIDLYKECSNIFYKKRFSFRDIFIRYLKDLLNILERR